MRTLGQVAVAAGFLVFLGSCNLNTDYFSDYNGVNLISGYGFSTSQWTTDTLGKDTTSANDLYMKWTDNGTTGPGGGESFNLEINNLIPNGDFDGTFNSPSIWAGTINAPAVNAGSKITGLNSLSFSGFDKTDILSLDVNTAVASVTGLANAASHNYQFQVDFIDTNTPEFKIVHSHTLDGSSGSTVVIDSTATTINTILALSSLSGVASSLNLIHSSTVASSLDFNNGSAAESFFLDNVRLVPDDLDLYSKARVATLTSTTNQLIPGKYRFVLYVKDDPNCGTANHFFANGITVRITAGTKSNLSKQFVASASRTSAWAGWTKLTFDLGTLDFVDSNVALEGSPALIIEISPTIMNSGTRDSGSLDVSDPALYFINS